MNKTQNIPFIFNPFIIYSIIWIIVILLYQLEWSDLYPKLSIELIIVLLSSVIVSFLIGYITWKKHSFQYKLPDCSLLYKKTKNIVKYLYVLTIIETIYCQKIPLINIIRGIHDGTYLNYGMPFVHIILVDGFAIVSMFYFYVFLNTNNRQEKKTCLKLFLLCLLYPIICSSRAQLLCMILPSFIFVCIKYFKVSYLLKIFSGSIIALYLFGVLGNIRNAGGDDSYILQVARANNNFYKTGIPNSYFWSYIYISSPLANTQHMVNNRGSVNENQEGITNLFRLIVPGIISRRISLSNEKLFFRNNADYLITENLNVGGVYYSAYGIDKWIGIYFMFFFYCIVMYLVCSIHPRSDFKIFAIAISVVITFFLIFNNPFASDGIILQLYLLIFVSFKYKNEKDRCIVSHI